MTLLPLTLLLFAGFVLLAFIAFLRSLRKRVGVLPAWRGDAVWDSLFRLRGDAPERAGTFCPWVMPDL